MRKINWDHFTHSLLLLTVVLSLFGLTWMFNTRLENMDKKLNIILYMMLPQEPEPKIEDRSTDSPTPEEESIDYSLEKEEDVKTGKRIYRFKQQIIKPNLNSRSNKDNSTGEFYIENRKELYNTDSNLDKSSFLLLNSLNKLNAKI